jgi:hypothetical protein
MDKLFFVLFLWMILPFPGFGQNADSTAVAEVPEPITQPEKKPKSGPIRNFFRKDYPNPTKAMIFSLVIPGAGQLYNKKYWKVPIVWGGYAAMIYFIDFSGTQYRYFKQEYIYAVDGDESTVSELMLYKGWGEDDIKEYRDLYHKKLELSYIGLAAMIVLSSADAFVDAHLMKFDVSEDLTLQIKPHIDLNTGAGNAIGLGLGFKLNPKNDLQPKVFFGNP